MEQQIKKLDLETILIDYAQGKQKIKEIQDYLSWIESEVLERYSEHDILSDYEGTETIETKKVECKLTFKLTKKIETDNLLFYAKEWDMEPEDLCSVKYDYSSTKIKKLSAEKAAEFKTNCIRLQRAKTSFDVRIKPQEE